MVKINTVIRITGVNPYVLVSATEAGRLKPNWRKPLPIVIEINGDQERQWRTNMMPTGHRTFYLYLHGEMRKHSQTKVGDRVTINIMFDEQYRNGPQHPMPTWFRKALVNNLSAKPNWQKLPPSRQKEILRYISRLKSSEAQARNLAQIIKALEGRPVHFMGRYWVDGK